MSGLTDREYKRLLDRLRRAVRTQDLWRPGHRLLMACSGGLDSTVAVALLLELRASLGHELVIAHVDHGLREESAEDARAVEDWSRALGLPFALRRVAIAPGTKLEARARQARYLALHEMAAQEGCERIVTAHHADDQAETLLMRLSHGAGVQALAGIRAMREDNVIRPLLSTSRAELRRCAERLQLSWRQDPSNNDKRHTRNRLRLEILPALEKIRPQTSRGFARTAAYMGEHAQATEFFLQDWLQRHLIILSETTVALPLSDLPPDVHALSLLLAALATRWRQPPPSQRAIAQVRAWLDKGNKRLTSCDLHRIRLDVRVNRLEIHTTNVAPPPGAD